MTTIKIQTAVPIIPIEIGELKFEFVTTDEAVLRFKKNATKFQQEVEGIVISEDDNTLEAAKDIARRGLDLLLGKGAFDQIYKQTPSIPLVTNYFLEVSEAIGNEINAMNAGTRPKMELEVSLPSTTGSDEVAVITVAKCRKCSYKLDKVEGASGIKCPRCNKVNFFK